MVTLCGDLVWSVILSGLSFRMAHTMAICLQLCVLGKESQLCMYMIMNTG